MTLRPISIQNYEDEWIHGMLYNIDEKEGRQNMASIIVGFDWLLNTLQTHPDLQALRYHAILKCIMI